MTHEFGDRLHVHDQDEEEGPVTAGSIERMAGESAYGVPNGQSLSSGFPFSTMMMDVRIIPSPMKSAAVSISP